MPKLHLYGLGLGIVGATLLGSCTKKEVINETTHTNIVVEDNSPPDYRGVTTVAIQSYINRLFVDLLGYEPTAAQLANYTASLKNNTLDSASRAAMLNDILGQADYYDFFDERYMGLYLNGYDSARIAQDIANLQAAQQNAYAGGNTQLAQLFGYEISKMQRLANAKQQYAARQIGINAYMAALIHNYAYDEINMGSLNFVFACFENLLKRQPSQQEQTAGVAMVNGNSAHLFLRDGLSKGDFVDIITTSAGFYEGLVIDCYRQLLARMPSSAEMGTWTIALQNGSKSYQDLQRALAITDEYAGF